MFFRDPRPFANVRYVLDGNVVLVPRDHDLRLLGVAVEARFLALQDGLVDRRYGQ